MTEEELSRLDDIRDRIASVANNIRIDAQAFDYRGGPVYLRQAGFFTYDTGGCHLAHCDTDDAGRVLTAVLGLSKAHSEYQGARLLLYDQYATDKDQAFA